MPAMALILQRRKNIAENILQEGDWDTNSSCFDIYEGLRPQVKSEQVKAQVIIKGLG